MALLLISSVVIVLVFDSDVCSPVHGLTVYRESYSLRPPAPPPTAALSNFKTSTTFSCHRPQLYCDLIVIVLSSGVDQQSSVHADTSGLLLVLLHALTSMVPAPRRCLHCVQSTVQVGCSFLPGFLFTFQRVLFFSLGRFGWPTEPQVGSRPLALGTS